MNKILKNKLVVGGVVFTILLIATLITLNYFTSTKSIRITYKNSRSIRVYDAAGDQEGKRETNKPIYALEKSGEAVRLNKEGSYIVTYKGNKGFESGFMTIDLAKSRTVTINPFYSQKRLAVMLEKEDVNIQLALANIRTIKRSESRLIAFTVN